MTGSDPHPEIERLLTGGHPNSLGRTPEVADRVSSGEWSIDDLLDTYASDDPVVRLRVSNALKRVTAADPDATARCIPRLLDEVALLDQASAQWTLAQLFGTLADRLSADERERAAEIMLRNLAVSDDWIVQNQTIATLADWATTSPALRDGLLPVLTGLAGSRRKSVAGRARKALARLDA